MTNKFAQIFGLLFLFFSSSCTHSPLGERSGVKEDSMTVDIKDHKERSVPKISEKTEQSPFGPLPVDASGRQFKAVPKKSKGPSALMISAGLYRSVSAISLFRELKVIDKVPPVLIGHGLSAVVVAYFAFGYQADFIEWKFFQFVEKVKNKKPFSEDWNELFASVLLKEIESKNIEEAQLTLVIPVWNKVKRKIEYLKRGSLKNALMANINYYGRQETIFEPAMSYGFIDTKFLKSLGINKVYALDLLSSGISWKSGDGLLNGSFQKAASIIRTEKDLLNTIINYPISSYELDDPTKLADLIFLSKDLAKKNLIEFTKEEEL